MIDTTTIHTGGRISVDHGGVEHVPGYSSSPTAFSSDLQIIVFGARGTGKSTISRLIAALLARRGLPVGLVTGVRTMDDSVGRDLEGKTMAEVLCPPAIVVKDTDSWLEPFELESGAGAATQAVVVTTPDVGAMQFAVQAAGVVRRAGVARVHLAINRAGSDAEMKRALDNLSRIDPANGVEYTSIHTLPVEPGPVPDSVAGWSDALGRRLGLRNSSLGNAVSWLVDDLVPSVSHTAG